MHYFSPHPPSDFFLPHAIELAVLWCPYTSDGSPDVSYDWPSFYCYCATLYGAIQEKETLTLHEISGQS